MLPAAIWGEKTGTFTNTDRTVHLSEQAVDPPGEARPDGEIFLDYARRLGLKDRDGEPLVKWTTPEECFEAWKECTRGRPCDYTGLSYEKLRGGSGIQWPCNDEAPEGSERLYADLTFPTVPDLCEDYGHDVVTGAAFTEADFRALGADGRAILKAAHWTVPHEWGGGEYPFTLTTGRTVYHFHTRTKTGRAPELQAAAPAPWAELFPNDAEKLGITEGDMVRVSSPRGTIVVPARVGGPARGGHLRSLPLRVLGRRRRCAPRRHAPRRERAHDHAMGPRLEAAAVQDRRRQGGEGMKIGPLLAHLQRAGRGLCWGAPRHRRAVHGGVRRLPSMPHVRCCGGSGNRESCGLFGSAIEAARSGSVPWRRPERSFWRSCGLSI